ncbi:hypothetical protein RQP46_006904 [Phenoliferia psychrophenolica]
MPDHGHGHDERVPLPVVSYEVVAPEALIPALCEDRPAQHYGFNLGLEWEYAHTGEGDTTHARYLRWLQPMEEELAKQVEYDMDEQDQLWLEGINADRKRDKEKPVSLEAFEIIFDKIEKEWFDLTKRVPKKAEHTPEQDSKCAICDDGECENSNAIVFCDGCNLAVHQDCYGVPYIPEGQWLCRKCTVSPDKTVSCVLCPNSYGAFKQTTTAHWAHLLCAIWIPDTGVSNTVYMEPIDGVENISKNRWKLICYLCRKRVGACIQCANRNCFTAFHVTCARERGLELKMKQGGERGELKAYCEKHSEGFVAPEGLASTSDGGVAIAPHPVERSHKRGGSAAAALAANNLVLKMSKSGGTKFVLKQLKSSKSARAYKKSYTSGPPLVPAFIFNRVVEYTKRLKFAKRPQFINQVCRYWSLKREARRGAPLLKRLHLEPWTASATSRQQTDAEKAKKLELIRLLRTDLEKVRMLTELVRKREKKKLERVQVFKGLMDDHLFSKTKVMRDVLDRIAALDKGRIFAQPVSRLAAPTYYDIIKHPMDWATMGDKLDRHEYLTATDFADDIDLVINNARRFNKPEHSIHKLAIKVHADAQPLLLALESLDHPDSVATRRAADLAGALSVEFLDELFDFRYEPESELSPEPELEETPLAVLDPIEAAVGKLDKGKGKEVVPRDRNKNRTRKRTAAAAALTDQAASRASPRAKVAAASAPDETAMEGVIVEAGEASGIVAPPLPEGDVPMNESPEILQLEDQFDEHGLPVLVRKPRRDRSRSLTGVAPVPPPAHLVEVAPRDTFKHFESGWILPEGTSRRRKVTTPPDGSAYSALPPSLAGPPAATPVEAESTPARKLKVTFAGTAAPPAPVPDEPPVAGPSSANVPLPPPAPAPAQSPLAIEDDDDEEPLPPFLSPAEAAVATASTGKTPRKKSTDKSSQRKLNDRDRLRARRMRIKEEEAAKTGLPAQSQVPPPPPKAPLPPPPPKLPPSTKAGPAPSPRPKTPAKPRVRIRKPKVPKVAAAAPTPGAVAPPTPGPVAPVAAPIVAPVASTSQLPLDGLPSIPPTPQEAERLRKAEDKRVRDKASRLRRKEKAALEAAQAAQAAQPVEAATKDGQAWRKLRAELEPSVRVTSLDQVPDGTLVWVKFSGSPLWPAEIADPNDAATPRALALARPDAEQIAKHGEYALVLFFDSAGSGGWTKLQDLFLLGENLEWDERVCLDKQAFEASKKKKGGHKSSLEKELRDAYQRALAEMETEAPPPVVAEGPPQDAALQLPPPAKPKRVRKKKVKA